MRINKRVLGILWYLAIITTITLTICVPIYVGIYLIAAIYLWILTLITARRHAGELIDFRAHYESKKRIAISPFMNSARYRILRGVKGHLVFLTIYVISVVYVSTH